MAIDQAKLRRRVEAARAAIHAAYGTEGDEFGATLFVSHHLEELEPAYWEEQFQTARPDPQRILDALVLRSEFDEEEDGGEQLDTLDFTLPGDVTDYVLCVTFGEEGEVEDISMES